MYVTVLVQGVRGWRSLSTPRVTADSEEDGRDRRQEGRNIGRQGGESGCAGGQTGGQDLAHRAIPARFLLPALPVHRG